MIPRSHWRARIEAAWGEAPIVWLAGVRRVGKTCLVQSFEAGGCRYLNCDLPSTVAWVRDPELFFRDCDRPVVIFDEIHQLPDPARLLKIGADAFPHLKLLATGSSNLAASRTFSDTLAGRKRLVHMTPVLWSELAAFGVTLQQRLERGGLPPALLATNKAPGFYREWLDSFFARDIQRLFGFRDVNRFNHFLEYILRQSGGLLEVTRAAATLGISRPTVESHLRALEATHAATLLRPFHGGGQNEIVKQPKVYGFDTGFVAFARGWDPLRPDDLGHLWEHLVLEHLQATEPQARIQYWRDKAGHELDFVLPREHGQVDVIECKWDPEAFEPRALRIFRAAYPHGRNYLISPQGIPARRHRWGDLEVQICTPEAYARP